MSNQDVPYPRPPVALIVTGQEWLSLSVMTLLSPRGYTVMRAFNGRQALQRIHESRVDLLILDKDMRDMSGVELARTVIEESRSQAATPIMMLSTSPWERDEKLDALRAGAWDVCSLPMDGEELMMRLDSWVRAKLAADATREQGLLDLETGLYNTQGLLRRIAELAAVASRTHRPLACVVLSPETPSDRPLAGAMAPPRTGTAMSPVAQTVADTLRNAGRASDAIGRLNDSEFVIVAPDTDMDGVRGLAERLGRILAESGDARPGDWNVRFGCYAVADVQDANVDPAEMLARAAQALRKAAQTSETIRFFDRTGMRN